MIAGKLLWCEGLSGSTEALAVHCFETYAYSCSWVHFLLGLASLWPLLPRITRSFTLSSRTGCSRLSGALAVA